LAFDVAGLLQTLTKSAQSIGEPIRRCGMEKSNHWHRWLLRASRKRPRRSRAAEQCDEVTPTDHSITFSAIASRLSGISRRRAFAVLRLITSSNLVGCTTGKSAGLSPLRIRPAQMPACRYASTRLGP